MLMLNATAASCISAAAEGLAGSLCMACPACAGQIVGGTVHEIRWTATEASHVQYQQEGASC